MDGEEISDLISRFEALLVRERLFREDFERRLKAELEATLEERMRVYHLRSPLAFDSGAKVFIHANDGHRLVLDMREPFMAHHLIEHGEWETSVREIIRKLLPVGGFFIDVGANIGVHSLFAASLVGPTGKVLALEPAPVTCDILRENVEINGLLSRIEIVNKAAGATSAETVAFEYFAEHPAMSGFKLNTARKDVLSTTPLTIAVPMITIDELLDQTERKPDFIKIDVEGFELQVLQGARHTLKTCPDATILIEHDSTSIKAFLDEGTIRMLWEIMLDTEMLAFAVEGDKSGLLLSYENFRNTDANLVLVHSGSRPHRILAG